MKNFIPKLSVYILIPLIVIAVAIIGLSSIILSQQKQISTIPETGQNCEEILGETYEASQTSVEVTKTDNVATAYSGQRLDYVITIVNNRTESTLIEYVVDTVPVELIVDASTINPSATFNTTNNTITWNNQGNGYIIDPQSTFLFTFSATVNQIDSEKTIINQARVKRACYCGDYYYDATDETTLSFEPDIVISKVNNHTKQEVQTGDTIAYTLFLQNTGQGAAHNVDVEDEIPEHVTVSDTGGGTLSADGTRLSWHFDTVSPGEEITITYSVIVSELPEGEDIEILNVVCAQCETYETSSSNNTASSSITTQNSNSNPASPDTLSNQDLPATGDKNMHTKVIIGVCIISLAFLIGFGKRIAKKTK